MKFYVVVYYYLVSLSFKFHEDLCINARARVVNVRAHVLSRLRAHVLSRLRAFITRAHLQLVRVYNSCAFTTCARTFMHKSL